MAVHGEVTCTEFNSNSSYGRGLHVGPAGKKVAKRRKASAPQAIDLEMSGGAAGGSAAECTDSSSALVVHEGVQCDGCGTFPIRGVRHKSQARYPERGACLLVWQDRNRVGWREGCCLSNHLPSVLLLLPCWCTQAAFPPS
jgi:hypothetical protein